MVSSAPFKLRLATEDDVPALHALIEASIRGLQANDYTQAQMEGALGTVLGLELVTFQSSKAASLARASRAFA